MKDSVGCVGESVITRITMMLLDAFGDANGTTMRAFEIATSIPPQPMEYLIRMLLYVYQAKFHILFLC